MYFLKPSSGLVVELSTIPTRTAVRRAIASLRQRLTKSANFRVATARLEDLSVLSDPMTMPERMEMIERTTAHLENVKVTYFDGLIVDYARKLDATAMIRGLRAMSDFEFEFQMALVNRTLYPDLVQVFLMPHEAYTHLNSTIVREVSSFGGDISSFVTPYVAEVLHKKFH